MISRLSPRATITTILLLTALGGCSTERPNAGPEPAARTTAAGEPGREVEGTDERFRALERRRGGRLGVYALDTGSGRSIAYRADERFAMASTVKVLAAAVALDQLSARDLERRVRWTGADLVDHSPVTELFVEEGMTIRQLIDASLTMSDNTAANLIFDVVGGPGVVDDWLDEADDRVTSVDRIEPELNDWAPGEMRDTSTPRALATTLDALLRGDLLTEPDRRLLLDELGDSLTGAGLVRAGVPASYVVGDKSGTAAYGTRNDVAIVWPPEGAPWIVAVMTSHDTADAETDDRLVAAATRVVVSALRR